MASYIYTVFETDPETFDNSQQVYSTTQKWKAQKYLRDVLNDGRSVDPFYVTRGRDGFVGTISLINGYEFLEIDLGEVL